MEATLNKVKVFFDRALTFETKDPLFSSQVFLSPNALPFRMSMSPRVRHTVVYS